MIINPYRYGAGGGGAEPPQTNLVQWLRADNIGGLSDGDPVSTWSDEQGTYDMTATGTQRPTYKTGIVNSLPVVRFDSSDDRLSGGPTFSGGSSQFSIFYVAAYNGSSAQRRAIQGSTNWLLGPYNGSWQWYVGVFRSLGTANSTFIVHGVIYDGTVDEGIAYLRQGGSTLSTANTGSGTEPGTLGLGAQGAFAEPMDGDIAEVVVYNTNLSSTVRDEVIDYFRTKYSIS